MFRYWAIIYQPNNYRASLILMLLVRRRPRVVTVITEAAVEASQARDFPWDTSGTKGAFLYMHTIMYV